MNTINAVAIPESRQAVIIQNKLQVLQRVICILLTAFILTALQTIPPACSYPVPENDYPITPRPYDNTKKHEEYEKLENPYFPGDIKQVAWINNDEIMIADGDYYPHCNRILRYIVSKNEFVPVLNGKFEKNISVAFGRDGKTFLILDNLTLDVIIMKDSRITFKKNLDNYQCISGNLKEIKNHIRIKNIAVKGGRGVIHIEIGIFGGHDVIKCDDIFINCNLSKEDTEFFRNYWNSNRLLTYDVRDDYVYYCTEYQVFPNRYIVLRKFSLDDSSLKKVLFLNKWQNPER